MTTAKLRFFCVLSVMTSARSRLNCVCSGSFKKRDSGRNDDETLVSRLVDRCLRPVFEKGWANDTQVGRRDAALSCPFRTSP